MRWKENPAAGGGVNEPSVEWHKGGLSYFCKHSSIGVERVEASDFHPAIGGACYFLWAKRK